MELQEMSPVIISIETTGLKVEDSEIVAIGIKTSKKTTILAGESEKKLLEKFYSKMMLLDDTVRDKVVLVGFNIIRFGIPFLCHATIRNNLENATVLASKLQEMKTIDLMCLITGYLLPGNVRYLELRRACSMFKIDGNSNLSREKIQELYKKGEFEKIKQHCIEDIELTYKLFLKLKNLAEYNLSKRYGIEVALRLSCQVKK